MANLNLSNNFGGEISSIKNIIKSKKVLVPTGYGTATANQIENFKFLEHSGATWSEIYTVPTGKTFYVSTIIAYGLANGDNSKLGTGTAGAETEIMKFYFSTGQLTIISNFNIPMKFSGGTRISLKLSAGDTGGITLVGWEE